MKLEISSHKRPNATYLQGVAGWVTGTPAGELKAGDHVVWNGGCPVKVTAVHEVSKCYIAIDTIEDGIQYYGRKLKKSRIVARPVGEL